MCVCVCVCVCVWIVLFRYLDNRFFFVGFVCVKISLCIHPERWYAWIDPGGVPFINSGFTYFLGNTSNGGMKCPVGLIQLTTVTRDPWSADWTEDIWRLPFNPKIFVCLCCTVVMPVSSHLQSLAGLLNDVHSGFVDLKILSYWFRSETPFSYEWRPSGVVTDISWWRRRKFFIRFLPVFSFLVQNGFLCKRDTRRLPLSSTKTFILSKDRSQPDHYLLHKEKLASYPVLFYCFTWAFLPVFNIKL